MERSSLAWCKPPFQASATCETGSGKRIPRAHPVHNQTVVLRPAVLGEIEDVLAEMFTQREIGADANYFIFLGQRARHDLPGGSNDDGAANHVVAIFRTAFSGRGNPNSILVGIGLQ